VEVSREKPLFADEETENDAAGTQLTSTQPEADMLGLVFANILR